MYSKWAEVTTMSYHSVKYERHIDEMDAAEFDFTIQRSPFKVAGRMVDKGHYILYDPMVSDQEALYIPSGFPYTNLMLDVDGKVFRGLNHYTISDAGCEFIFNIIKSEYQRIPESFVCELISRNGRKEVLVMAETDSFHWSEYTGQAGETVLDIAKKFSVSAYLLIERNANLTGYLDDCSGLKLQIPSHYGEVVKLYVDAEHGMPTMIENYDEKGLYERYTYTDYKFNFKLPSDYFTEDHLESLE